MNPDTVCWMQALADHHSAMRARHPHERLLVMFDIDGTLLDTRCTMLWVLREYDVVHGTRWFEAFDPNAIRWHEARVERVLEDAGVPPEERTPIDAWYRARFWNAETMRNSLHAFEGAMDLVRHLQRTPGTEIALNTGRPEFLRAPTLRALNAVAETHDVRFASRLLYMKRGGWEDAVADGKAAGVRHFRDAGYRIVAMIDNEPENLAAVESEDADGEILLLHADTLFLTDLDCLPARAIVGDRYHTRPFRPMVLGLPAVA